MKKKIILISLIAIVLIAGLFVLTGCGNKNNENTTSNIKNSSTEKNDVAYVEIGNDKYKLQSKSELNELHYLENYVDFNTDFMQVGDFLYADPPYLISCGSYNDGKRGFEGWSEEDDLALYEKLDTLSDNGVSFALSNVIRHKGAENTNLIEWAERYDIHYINASYANSNYQARESETVEVLITNY